MKILLLLSFFLIFGCDRKEPIEEHDVFDLAMSGPLSAGDDRHVLRKETVLVGDSSNIHPSTSFAWTQLVGPAVKIETPFGLHTKVSDLSTGIYMFALSRTDGSETLSDTVVITVTM